MKLSRTLITLLALTSLQIGCQRLYPAQKGYSEVHETHANQTAWRIMGGDALSQFNAALSKSKQPATAKAIMQLYTPTETEGQSANQITEKRIDANTTAIELFENELLDDSLKARKVKITLSQHAGQLHATSIQETYQCYRNNTPNRWVSILCP
ncbi:hypothetical protein [Ostreibacterium oceani]|uniref:Uncharacterized protein n=1 Tax=Ostreibacterium oceani TaxID=2654998 RepID=A0A6N7EVG3_9GAMM|nr:hypothetical protein [Ostreibacterium oceani]MPV86462.1 hypothetical protein [Ostreibacterium oceani]